MLYFPQLSSGALTQYPVSKERRSATITNTTADGRVLKAPDYGVSEIAWEMRHTGLTDTELATLEDLFKQTEGRLVNFTFLDPMSNLLLWSENPSAGAWTRGPLLQVAPVEDPFGTMRATRISNSGAAEQSVEQTISGPGWFYYCFSFFARAATGTQATVYRTVVGQTDSAVVELGSTWEKVALGGKFESPEESVTFGLALAPGAIIDVFGFQAQPQVSPSPYKPSTTRSGVHSNARFAEDTLRIISHHVNQHSAVIRIVAAIKN